MSIPSAESIKGALAAFELPTDGTYEEIHSRLGRHLVAKMLLGTSPSPTEATSSKAAGKKTSKQANFPDPFEDLEEETLDDCFEELYGTESLEHLEDELKHGYNCTKDQAVYWLKKKYMTTTSYGEDLYRRLTSKTTESP